MPPENPAIRLLAHLPQVDLLEQGLDGVAPLAARDQALEHREVIEHVVGRDPRVDPEVLRQVAQRRAQPGRLGEHVDAVEHDRAGGRDLQRRHASHQRGLACPVGAEQSEHAARDVERDVIERTGTTVVAVGQAGDREHAGLQVGRGGQDSRSKRGAASPAGSPGR